MDGSLYRIRPFQDGDFEAESRMTNRLFPENPVSAEEIRHFHDSLEVPGVFKSPWAVEKIGSGEVVALGMIFHAPWAFDPDRYWVSLGVEPAHQHRGIGRSLYQTLEGIAISRRAKALWATVRSDHPRCVQFFERAAFVERRRNWTSILDLTQVPPDRSHRNRETKNLEGVEFTSVAREGPGQDDAQERLYRLDCESGKDAPRMGPSTDLPFDQFIDLVFRGPGYLPEGILVAKVGDEYVAYTYVFKLPSQPDTLHVGFTGTLPAYRGRGIASELKLRAIELTRSLGYHYLMTNNDTVNKRIWAINEKLGFQQVRTWIQGQKDLVRTG